MLVKCQSCSATISDAADVCPKCRARGDSLFGPLIKPRSESAPRSARSLQKRPGFTQGGFGKAMGYLLFVFGVLAAIGLVRNWLVEPLSARSPGFMFGTFLGMAAMLGGAWRAIVKRNRRLVIDWICAAYLVFSSVVTAFNAVVAFTSPEIGYGGALVFLGSVSAGFSAICLLVAIRLMRRPFPAAQSAARLAETFE